MEIKAIIGLGNPGPKYMRMRHNVGFRVVDRVAENVGAAWREKENMELAEVNLEGKKIFLIKPQTYMNNSGEVIPFLSKQGIKTENILVVHDDIEIKFGEVKFKTGGSAKGHNGLKSLIAYSGDGFHRVRVGVGRPGDREEVPNYVLRNFSESEDEVNELIYNATQMVMEAIKND